MNEGDGDPKKIHACAPVNGLAMCPACLAAIKIAGVTSGAGLRAHADG